MRIAIVVLAVLLAVGVGAVGFGGCVNRPAWPERDGGRALRARGFPAELVDRLVKGAPVTTGEFDRLARVRHRDVRFLVARHPHIGPERMREYAAHSDDYVRSGVAQNPAISAELVTQLRADESHTVWVGLARNPSLDARTLLEIQAEHDLGWSWFALNPNCPPEVEARIRASGDPSALHWLERRGKTGG